MMKRSVDAMDFYPFEMILDKGRVTRFCFLLLIKVADFSGNTSRASAILGKANIG